MPLGHSRLQTNVGQMFTGTDYLVQKTWHDIIQPSSLLPPPLVKPPSSVEPQIKYIAESQASFSFKGRTYRIFTYYLHEQI